ncbi:MAG: ATP-binding cassette domain-containing protein [Lactobacillales bacterium]|jgi:ABC-2 type transport system ATP-binding protein|nr:ATP-binding cassette domain-containing protein [Lactobacillales bacterium]
MSITIEKLSKKFKDKLAIDFLTFTAKSGKVTGFLGANGAGKTTTIRILLGLVKPTTGKALIDGIAYVNIKNPLTLVGAMIDSKAYHKQRTAYNHLHFIAAAAGLPKKRVEIVLEMTGLASVAKKKIGDFSLGMTQRLGIAAALLGNPKNLILDEPVNGLDPEGIIWIRELCKAYASKGNTVLISSHLMSEVENTVDDVVIIGKGKLLAKGSLKDILKAHESSKLEEVFLNLTKNSTEYNAQKISEYF